MRMDVTVEDVRCVVLVEVKCQTGRGHPSWTHVVASGCSRADDRQLDQFRCCCVLLLFPLEHVNVFHVVQTKHVGVEFHLFDFHGQLFLNDPAAPTTTGSTGIAAITSTTRPVIRSATCQK